MISHLTILIKLPWWNGTTTRVTNATTFDAIEPLPSVSRWEKGQKQKMSVQQSHLAKQYIMYMIRSTATWLAVREAQNSNTGNEKWQRTVFLRITDMVVINTNMFFNNSEEKKNQRNQREIGLSYLKIGHNIMKSNSRSMRFQTSEKSVLDRARLDERGHLIGRETNRESAFSNCSGKPLTFCKTCDVTLHTTCFPQFHLYFLFL